MNDERPDTATRDTATLGGGCFWCTEAVFARLAGVRSVVPGYAGGHVEDPTYAQVCDGTTGHAEVIQITFDPAIVSFAEVLEVFFLTHDPTTKNRQGADVGTQYRSVVLYHSEAQRQIAEAVIEALNDSGAYDAPLVTEVAPCTRFHPAEDVHHDYFARNAAQPYCVAVIQPKIEKFEAAFRDRMKTSSDG